jgi:hypothetical protein
LVWNPPPEGLHVVIHDEKAETFSVAQLIGTALQKGDEHVDFTGAGWVKPKEICIVVGVRPEK